MRSKRSLGLLVYGMLCVSVGLNFALGHSLGKLRAQYDRLISRDANVVGVKLANLHVKDFQTGTPATLDLTSPKPSILYVFSPSCIWCAANLSNIQALSANESSTHSGQVIGLAISTAGLHEYVQQHHLNFPIYTDIPDAAQVGLRMGGTPQTIVVANGVVVQNWSGAYASKTGKEIQAMFHLKLPGLGKIEHAAPKTPSSPSAAQS